MTRDDHEVSLLNDLIRATMDSVEGYRESADKAASHELKSQLADRALERLRVVALLRDQVQFLGGQAEDSVTLAGTAHRIFVNLKQVVAARDEEALIEEIRRGETHLIDRFDAALSDQSASIDTLEVIEEGHRRISAGYGRMLALVSPQR